MKKSKSNSLKSDKYVWGFLIYGLFYLISFFLLERSNAPINIIHCKLDDVIPFCEYFIVFYISWFVLLAVTIYYFVFHCQNREEYYQLATTMCTGMTVFLIVSFVYPNGHDLRPQLSGDSIFIKAVSMIYYFDTSTNILPSLHVYEAVACCIAILENKNLRKRKWVSWGITILTVSIIASTMFLKQHSVIDVVFALVLNVICYWLFYKWAVKYKDKIGLYLNKKELCTIPNCLSFFRLFLAIILAGFSYRWDMDDQKGLMIGIVLLSALTDFLDGKIARKCHMVSEVGKILDPIADKVTQGVLLFCFIEKYPVVRSLLLLFVIKEAYMMIMGTKTIMKTHENEGAMWYGKVNTAIFYGVITIIVFSGNIPKQAVDFLFLISAFWMLMSFLLYARQYHAKLGNTVTKKKRYNF